MAARTKWSSACWGDRRHQARRVREGSEGVSGEKQSGPPPRHKNYDPRAKSSSFPPRRLEVTGKNSAAIATEFERIALQDYYFVKRLHRTVDFYWSHSKPGFHTDFFTALAIPRRPVISRNGRRCRDPEQKIARAFYTGRPGAWIPVSEREPGPTQRADSRSVASSPRCACRAATRWGRRERIPSRLDRAAGGIWK
jgi:hypothetical protein